MATVIMYSTEYCPFCIRARQLLDRKGVAYTDIRVDTYPDKRAEMVKKSNRSTVPQLFINGLSIGGCDDLHALEQSGELDKLLLKKDIT